MRDRIDLKRNTLLDLAQEIADTAYILDLHRCAPRAHLAAKPMGVNLDRIAREASAGNSERLFFDRADGHHLTLAADENPQQCNFPAPVHDVPFAIHDGLVALNVEHEVPHL